MSRVHVVTGAGSGIGAATAAILREKGETVVGVDLKGAEVTADLSTPEGRAAAVKDVLAATDGRVDTVIACAGISAPSALTVSVNHYGVVAFLDALRPTLAESSTPRAAVVSSMSSLQPNHAPSWTPCSPGPRPTRRPSPSSSPPTRVLAAPSTPPPSARSPAGCARGPSPRSGPARGSPERGGPPASSPRP